MKDWKAAVRRSKQWKSQSGAQAKPLLPLVSRYPDEQAAWEKRRREEGGHE
jgi:hypothetical protein